MSKTYLKIKVVSLAAEAVLIRREEKRWPGPSETRQGLRHHRTYDVRREARAALLAYGFLRGRTYAQIEGDWRLKDVPTARVATLVLKYGEDKRLTVDDIIAWVKDAPVVRDRPRVTPRGVMGVTA